ncbi:diguanylate cyclase [Acidaminobacter sp. JC074]|uniref:GGDEF domain-containing protein n=1 Tax=Acidaminobacter sp. JC074 TaxID=2530199 RepID=UPI001F0FB084|nr:diguanylate cyclase [Acidaminobacter sp. JC074]MCH4889046.1 diguanylate cyclase [Acidaminobacter sp. JC074]
MSEFYLKDELYKSHQNISEFFIEKAVDVVFYRDLIIPDNQYHSPKFWKILGYEPETKSHLSNELYMHLLPEDRGLLDDGIERLKEDALAPFDKLLRFKHRKGHTIWMRCHMMIIKDELDRPFRLLAVMNDVSQVKALQEQVENKDHKVSGLKDMLKAYEIKDHNSGFYNRLVMEELLLNEKDRSDRKKRIFSVMMLTINNYDQLKMDFGIGVEEKMVKNISKRLNLLLRKQDLKCRYNESTFLILLPETGTVDLQDVRRKLLKDMDNWHLLVRNSQIHYSCKIGMTSYNQHETIDNVIDRLDSDLNN